LHINNEEDRATVIRDAELIVFDEAPMAHRHILEAMDRSFKDIMRVTDDSLKHVPFGGKLIVLAGDFRQV
jgi:hypothetical protein